MSYIHQRDVTENVKIYIFCDVNHLKIVNVLLIVDDKSTTTSCRQVAVTNHFFADNKGINTLPTFCRF